MSEQRERIMDISWIEINWICWILAFIVAALMLTAGNMKVVVLDALKAILLVAGAGLAAIFGWEGSIFIVSLTIAGIFLIGNLFIFD